MLGVFFFVLLSLRGRRTRFLLVQIIRAVLLLLLLFRFDFFLLRAGRFMRFVFSCNKFLLYVNLNDDGIIWWKRKLTINHIFCFSMNYVRDRPLPYVWRLMSCARARAAVHPATKYNAR